MGLFNARGSVGLVIEPGSVKAVAARRVRGALAVTRFAEAGIPQGPDDENYAEALAGAIGGLFDDNNLSRDQVVVAFNSSDAVLRQVTLPFHDDARIRKTIKFEVEETLPFPVEGCVVDYHVGRTVEGKTEVFVAAAAKERISGLLNILARCGIDPVAVELDVAALINVAAWAGTLEGRGVIVDIGRQTTKALVYDGKVVFWRAFRTRPVQGLASELRRSLLSAGLDAEPQVIHLCGSYPDLDDIQKSLSQIMGIETVSFPPAGGTPGAAAASALGCALKIMGFDASSVNFRQEEFAYRRQLEHLAVGLITLASLVLVCGVLWNVRLTRVAGLVARQQELIRGNAAEMWKGAGVTGSAPETTEEIAAELAELVEVMKTGIAKVDRKAKRSVLDEWKGWSALVPAGLDIVFDEIRTSQKRITVSGTTTSAADAEVLQAALNKRKRFRFELPETSRAPDGRTRFTVRHEYE